MERRDAQPGELEVGPLAPCAADAEACGGLLQVERSARAPAEPCPVIGSEQESFRIALVQAFRQILKSSLNLLGISVLEEM